MRELSLFTGAGGGLLGTQLLGWQTVGAVEIDDDCCRMLDARQRDGSFPSFPIWNMDIREFNRAVAHRYRGRVDVITAGFPCPPFSVAGKRLGAEDPRNMWPATLECIQVVRPPVVYLENVPGLLARNRRTIYKVLLRGKRRRRHVEAITQDFPSYYGRVLGDLGQSGYDCRYRILSAAEMGAPHKRDRLWVVARNASGNGWARSERFRRGRLPSPEEFVAKWPTPTVNGDYNRKGLSKNSGDGLATAVKVWPTPQSHAAAPGNPERVGRFGTQHGGRNLNDEVAKWPTPQAYSSRDSRPPGINALDIAVRNMYPTPNATDGKGPSTRSEGKERPKCDDDLPDAVAAAGPSGTLNPQWVEWLMGWPPNHTSLLPTDGTPHQGWEVEPPIPRVSTGVKNRTARLKALGNGWVPQTGAMGWLLLTEDLFHD